MSLYLFDTHCHLNRTPLADKLDTLLAEARNAGVSSWLVPGIEPSGWPSIKSVSDFTSIFPAYGIHPAFIDSAGAESIELLESFAGGAVAIGEVGLDKGAGDQDLQEKYFREQIRIAKRHSLPLIIHCRGRTGRTLEILQEERGDKVGGIMHAFSGSIESAMQFINAGFAISISGAVTRPGARRLLNLAATLPAESLLLETDAPDMMPASRNGEFNRPSWLIDTAETVAAARGTTVEQLAEITAANARRYLGIK